MEAQENSDPPEEVLDESDLQHDQIEEQKIILKLQQELTVS